MALKVLNEESPAGECPGDPSPSECHGRYRLSHNDGPDRPAEGEMGIEVLHLVTEMMKPSAPLQNTRHRGLRSGRLDQFHHGLIRRRTLQKGYPHILQRIMHNL